MANEFEERLINGGRGSSIGASTTATKTNLSRTAPTQKNYTTPQYVSRVGYEDLNAGRGVTPGTSTTTSSVPVRQATNSRTTPVIEQDNFYPTSSVTTPVAYTPPSSSSLDSLIAKLSSMPYDKQYSDMMAGNLRQDLMNTAASTRSELANRLSTAGVEGGVAQNQLADVDRTASMGMASGMSDIYQKSMEQAFADRQAALTASIQKYGVDAETAAQMAALQVQKEYNAGQLDISNKQLALDKLLGMGQLDLNRELGFGQLDLNKELGLGQLDLDRLLGEGQLDINRGRLDLDSTLGRTDREIEMEKLNQEFGLRTTEDQMNFALQLLQLAQYADAEEAKRLQSIASEILGFDTSTTTTIVEG
jgi:hypothetical protein